jgi:Flp pilus assembly pilin Flp
MIKNTFKRFLNEDDGMEMVEWSIVGVVFALGAATVWTTLGASIGTALGNVGTCVEGGVCP